MTVLSAVQAACRMPSMGVYPAPSALFTSTEQLEIQLCALANEAAAMIAKAHDWQKFTTLKTQAGDGATTAFALPTDYDRMPVKASVFKNSTKYPIVRVRDTDEWLDLQLQNYTGNAGGWWVILGGQINVQPALAASDSAKYYYQSNLIVAPASGSNKTAFTLDTDTFRLDERLLKLAIVFMWRQQTGLDYEKELADFNQAMAQEVARDKGSRMIKIGAARMPDGVQVAYPGVIAG